MLIVNHLRYTRTARLKVGELIRIRLGGNEALALTLVVKPERISLGVLEMPNAGRAIPFEVGMEPVGRCVSLGTDFIFEVGASGELASASRRFEPGALSLGEEGQIVLMFAPFQDHMSSEIGFDLVSGEFCDPPGDHCAVVTSWRIWQCAADRIRPNSVPILDFRLPANDAVA